MLAAFLACQFISLTRVAWIGWLGGDVGPLAAGANVLSVIFAGGLAAAYLRREGLQLSGFGKSLLIMLGAWVGVMLVVGLLHGWMLREIAIDFAAWLILLAFLIAGASDAFWDDLRKVAPYFLFAGVLVCALSLREIYQLADLAISGERIARDLSAYRLVWVLYLFPIMLLLANPQKPSQYFLASLAAVLALELQIIFQKRMETLFICALFVLVIWRLFLALRSGKLFRAEGPIRILVVSGFLLVAASLLAGILVPKVLGTQAQMLVGRFSTLTESPTNLPSAEIIDGEASLQGAKVEIEGRWNERWWIVMNSLREFGAVDWVFGRGFGGYVAFSHPVIDLYMSRDDRSQLLAAYIMQETGAIGRRQTEIGFVMPLIKGGFPAQILFVITLLYAFSRKVNSDWLGHACKIFLALYVVRYLNGGAFILSDAVQFAVFCAALGRCMREQRPAYSGLNPSSHTCTQLRS
uniref:Uncharacterized protein n=2 Tax=Rhodocyclus tenuis TaxID=1066 RepID=A0A840G2X9_RHOTE|nr:hypothetical protein [Rhodocyclus tenuis]